MKLKIIFLILILIFFVAIAEDVYSNDKNNNGLDPIGNYGDDDINKNEKRHCCKHPSSPNDEG